MINNFQFELRSTFIFFGMFFIVIKRWYLTFPCTSSSNIRPCSKRQHFNGRQRVFNLRFSISKYFSLSVCIYQIINCIFNAISNYWDILISDLLFGNRHWKTFGKVEYLKIYALKIQQNGLLETYLHLSKRTERVVIGIKHLSHN